MARLLRGLCVVCLAMATLAACVSPVSAQEDDLQFEGTVDLGLFPPGGEPTSNFVELYIPPFGGPVSGRVYFRIERMPWAFWVAFLEDTENPYPDCTLTLEVDLVVTSGTYSPPNEAITGTMTGTSGWSDIQACDPDLTEQQTTGETTWQASYNPSIGREVTGSIDFGDEDNPLEFKVGKVRIPTTTTEPVAEPTEPGSSETTQAVEEPEEGQEAQEGQQPADGPTLHHELAAIVITSTDRDCDNEDDTFHTFVVETPTRRFEGSVYDMPQARLAGPGDVLRVPTGYLVSINGEGVLRGPAIVEYPCRDIRGAGWSLLQGLGFFKYTPRRPPWHWWKTPHVAAAVLGTEFILDVTESTTQVLVLEGTVTVEHDSGGTQTVTAGQWIHADDQSLSTPLQISPNDIDARYPWLADAQAVLSETDQAGSAAQTAAGPRSTSGLIIAVVAVAGAVWLALAVFIVLVMKRRRREAYDALPTSGLPDPTSSVGYPPPEQPSPTQHPSRSP